jgi:localization factor PodJL
MQPDLPWNVAGIPPEAREAARAAARREGLSVGEWLTRSILRNLSGAAEAVHDRQEVSKFAAPEPLAHSIPDTGHLLERIAQTESDATSAFRKIDEQLRGLARRVDASERTQQENSKTVTLAATEISSASRDQAEAFDQLGQHVSGLGDRLNRLERNIAADGVRDAVKGLHSGLSRLADQIAENASQSTTQFATATRNIESLSSKLNDARAETNNVQRTLSSKMHGFEERTLAVETATQAAAEKADKAVAETVRFADARAETLNAQRALSSRLQTVEDRARAAESTSKTTADKLEKVAEDLETARGAQRAEQSESQRQAQLITQLSDALDKLSSRLTSGESQTAGAVTRLEDQIGTIESRRGDAPLHRRLQGVEHTLSELAGRFENIERNVLDSGIAIDENFRTLSARLDDAEERRRETGGAASSTLRQTPLPPMVAISSPAESAATAKPESSTLVGRAMSADLAPSILPGRNDPPPLLAPEVSEPTPSLDTLLELDTPLEPEAPPKVEQLPEEAAGATLAAALQASRSAAATQTADLRVGPGQFSWSAKQSTVRQRPAKKRRTSMRYVLVGGILVIAAGAVAAGILLSQGLVAPVSVIPAETPIQIGGVQKKTPKAQLPTGAQPGSKSATTTDKVVSRAPVPSTPNLAPPSKPIVGTALSPQAKVVPPAPLPTRQVAQPSAPPALTDAQKTAAVAAHLSALADAGNPKAELLLGLQYLDGVGTNVNEAEAAKWLERAANTGEAIAAYRLGTLYERGHGVPADAGKAMHWYSLAAKLGNRKAMHNLAVAYAEGSGGPKDLTQAAQWFSKAAALGLGDSEFNLAVLYERGMGVQQSLIDAYKWYAIAAAQGDSESKARLDVISTQLNADERAAAQKAAAEFHPQPLDRNANVPPDPTSIG